MTTILLALVANQAIAAMLWLDFYDLIIRKAQAKARGRLHEPLEKGDVMTLKAKIDAYKKEFVAKAPPEALAVMQRATEDLQHSGILDRAVQVGAPAPDFKLANTEGADVALAALQDRGPLVLSFYRGRW